MTSVFCACPFQLEVFFFSFRNDVNFRTISYACLSAYLMSSSKDSTTDNT